MLTQAQVKTHEFALYVGREHRRIEGLLIKILQKVEAQKIYQVLGYTSLFDYAVRAMGLAESVAYASISVARKARAIPKLKEAIESENLSVAKASRMVSALTIENASHLIAFAKAHSTRDLECEVAKISPKARTHERTRAISGELVEVKVFLSKEVFKNLKRAQDLGAQKRSKHLDLAATLELVLEDFVTRNDPIQKAERASARSQVRKQRAQVREKEGQLRTFRVQKRQPLRAATKQEVTLRDQGRCTFVDQQGRRCSSRRWLEVHHLLKVSQGGTNEPSNLATLCSTHHDLVHQLSLPIDGQVSWVREKKVEYKTRGTRRTSLPAGSSSRVSSIHSGLGAFVRREKQFQIDHDDSNKCG